MSFAWRDYLTLATSLAGGTGEAAFRAAASRAYYAAFGRARQWLEANQPGYRPSDPGNSHKVVWDRFDAGPERQKRQIANLGNKLKVTRVTADYNSSAQVSKLDADTAVKHAETLISLLDQMAH